MKLTMLCFEICILYYADYTTAMTEDQKPAASPRVTARPSTLRRRTALLPTLSRGDNYE